MAPNGPYNSCDACRRKKVKCAPVPGEPEPNPNVPNSRCISCIRSREKCTFERGYKKPGRPSVGERRARMEGYEDSQSPNTHRSPRPQETSPVKTVPFASTSEPWRDEARTSVAGVPPEGVGADLSPLINFLADEGSLSQVSPTNLVTGGGISNEGDTHRPLVFPSVPLSSQSNIEDVAPWSAISFFLTLYLRYMHSLFPLVHKPSFAQAVTLRSDQGDRSFRALILALVAYTIGQAPLSRMEPMYTRAELERLQRRCHRVSLLLLDRNYSTVSVAHVGVLIANYFCCQSMGHVNRAFAFLSEACQLTHILRMHDPQEEGSVVERELRRRIFWHVYAVDITEAAAGNMIHLNDFEGLPPLPLAVDDELITPQGAFPQPAGGSSYMAGFNGCVQLFPLMADCIVRTRRLQVRRRDGGTLSAEEVENELVWEMGVRDQLDGMMATLPPELSANSPPQIESNPDRDAILGMQRANILVTEASLRIALFDYVAELSPASDLAAERSELAHRAYETLAGISLDDLAANGESIRGKIFRIVMALLRSPAMGSDWVDMVHSWWALFSRINFVQLAPRSMLLDSQAQSPLSGE